MSEISIKDLIIKIYSNLIEENINSWLNTKEVFKKSNMNPEENIKLKKKIRNISQKISNEFADKIIAEGFPDKEIHTNKVKFILNSIIKKKIKELE